LNLFSRFRICCIGKSRTFARFHCPLRQLLQVEWRRKIKAVVFDAERLQTKGTPTRLQHTACGASVIYNYWRIQKMLDATWL
jgi:hypothetical protein